MASLRSALRRMGARTSVLALLTGCFGVDAADRRALNAEAGVPPETPNAPRDAGIERGMDAAAAADAGRVSDAALSEAPDATPADGAAELDTGVEVDATYEYPLLAANCRAPYTDSARYHDLDYADSAKHGLAAKLATDNCRSCHADDLVGCARAPACDNCHSGGHDNGWRTDCIFCHGGADNITGAPPRFLDDTDLDRGALTFLVHTEHVTEGDHPAYDCVQCHVKPVDVLSRGHMFDAPTDSPGRAEVNFAAGLSKSGSFAAGTCSNLYCHGNGRSTGNVVHTAPSISCSGCHADRSTPNAFGGSHPQHLTTTEGGSIGCAECHGGVVSSDSAISTKARHVDGHVDVTMPAGISMDASKTCTGACHGFTHGGFLFPTRTW